MRELSILLIGDGRRPEFHEGLTVLGQAGRVIPLTNVEQAVQGVDEAPPPDVIVVAQSWPGEFSSAEIGRLRRCFPLTRILALLGTWCEGELRSGAPWPADERIHAHQAGYRLAAELARLAEGRLPAWGLPSTASEEERLLLRNDIWPTADQGLIVVHSPDRDLAEMLSSAAAQQGFRAVWRLQTNPAQPSDAAAVFWDGDVDRPGVWLRDLARVVAAFATAPVIVLLNFPRLEDCRRARKAGAAAVVSKPLLLDDLRSLLAEHVGEDVSPISRPSAAIVA